MDESLKKDHLPTISHTANPNNPISVGILPAAFSFYLVPVVLSLLTFFFSVLKYSLHPGRFIVPIIATICMYCGLTLIGIFYSSGYQIMHGCGIFFLVGGATVLMAYLTFINDDGICYRCHRQGLRDHDTMQVIEASDDNGDSQPRSTKGIDQNSSISKLRMILFSLFIACCVCTFTITTIQGMEYDEKYNDLLYNLLAIFEFADIILLIIIITTVVPDVNRLQPILRIKQNSTLLNEKSFEMNLVKK
ncbi:Frag1/DRAM/Sfk1 like protein [Aduncisulcus paluster]|uniref:Frag1/DRAM/Sfk1 like protein n=1 Tax=Aduncisulcus paluster TaxID=2918883 RepID=A0ABQ5KV54_9EUKA|nr:Frag1/DRAM/Sfk1 like protein [Aduncisulcus paluster]